MMNVVIGHLKRWAGRQRRQQKYRHVKTCLRFLSIPWPEICQIRKNSRIAHWTSGAKQVWVKLKLPSIFPRLKPVACLRFWVLCRPFDFAKLWISIKRYWMGWAFFQVAINICPFPILPEGSIFWFEFREFPRTTRKWKWRPCYQVKSTNKIHDKMIRAFTQIGLHLTTCELSSYRTTFFGSFIVCLLLFFLFFSLFFFFFFFWGGGGGREGGLSHYIFKVLLDCFFQTACYFCVSPTPLVWYFGNYRRLSFPDTHFSINND